MELTKLFDDDHPPLSLFQETKSDIKAYFLSGEKKVVEPKTDQTFSMFSDLEAKSPALKVDSAFDVENKENIMLEIKAKVTESEGNNHNYMYSKAKVQENAAIPYTSFETESTESIESWDSLKLKSHLLSFGFKNELANKFEEHGIKGAHLVNCKYFRKPQQLANMGITKYGDQIDTLEAIKKICRQFCPKPNKKKVVEKKQHKKKLKKQKIVAKAIGESYNYDEEHKSVKVENEQLKAEPEPLRMPAAKVEDDEELLIISEIKMLMSRSVQGITETKTPSPQSTPSPALQGTPSVGPKRVVLFQSPTYEKKMLMNMDKEREEERDVFIADFLAENLYPHQLDGVRFMWKNVVQEDAGCVLAHSMGLGKTIQAVSFVYTLIQQRLVGNPDIPKELGKRILIVCPPVVISNWKNEFHKWISAAYINSVHIFLACNYSSLLSKIQMLEVWNNKGGVLIIGYQMLRELLKQIDEEEKKESEDDEVVIVNGKIKKVEELNKRLMLRLKHLLLEGADLIITDEGHHIKDLSSQLSHQVNRFKTKHRVCLTGYPLQNNLIEYYCMIDFVRPDYLVNICRYRSRYVTPIAAGSFKDSTFDQKKNAAQWLFILGKIIEPIIHRLDNGILRVTLPPKSEFKIQLKMSPLQTELYSQYLGFLQSSGLSNSQNFMDSVFVKTMVLTRILNHPACLWSWHKAGHSTAKYDENNNLVSGGFYSVPPPPMPKPKRKRSITVDQMSGLLLNSDFVEEEWRAIDLNWAETLYKENNVNLLEHSHKMQVIMTIMRECKKLRERVLIFSRSLPTLDFIQDVFEDHEVTYYRIDGSVPQIRRTVMIDEFTNSPNASDAFLISTMAGSLGINLTRASRVILVDLGWNPCHDEQAIGRVFRFSQIRPTFVYRLQTYGTIESKLYNLNVYKQAMSLRVLDHRNIEKHFRKDQLVSFFKKPEEPPKEQDISADLSKDPLLKKIVEVHPDVLGVSCHISFLEKESDDTIDRTAYMEAEELVYKEQRRLEYYRRYGPNATLPQGLMDPLEQTYLQNKKTEETKLASRNEKESVLRAYEEKKIENAGGYQTPSQLR